MKKYIDADKLKKLIDEKWKDLADKGVKVGGGKYEIEIYTYLSVLRLIDSLQQEQTEGDLFERPVTPIKDAIEVTSRMQYIDDDLKPIAEFILDYASWNLHKDEWNQPVIEVPLFRVLDALAQRGKPYCCAD